MILCDSTFKASYQQLFHTSCVVPVYKIIKWFVYGSALLPRINMYTLPRISVVSIFSEKRYIHSFFFFFFDSLALSCGCRYEYSWIWTLLNWENKKIHKCESWPWKEFISVFIGCFLLLEIWTILREYWQVLSPTKKGFWSGFRKWEKSRTLQHPFVEIIIMQLLMQF